MSETSTSNPAGPRSQSVEDYLKAVYELTLNSERASTNALAEYLGIAAASVTGMLQKLAEGDEVLVEYRKHHGVALTDEGRKAALETIRYHRLIELFLVQILGYEWHEVHAEADRLEHVISKQFVERIAAALGDPEHDPHGDPIPRPDLTMPESAQTVLSGLEVGDEGVVKRVRDTFPELLKFLNEQGLVPGAKFRITEIAETDHNLHVMVADRGQEIVLGPRASNQVYVSLTE
jgi:DtxR family Mn-dependent transcriptional regulator